VGRVGRRDAGADAAGVVNGGLLCSPVTWRRRMGRAVSLGAGDVAPLGGFVDGVGGQRGGRRAGPSLAQIWAFTGGSTAAVAAARC